MTNVPAAPANESELYLLAQIRDAFGRVAYSHKTHEKQADICLGRHRTLQWTLVGLTAFSSGTFLVALAGALTTPKVSSIVTSFVAVLVSAITLAAKTFTFYDDSDAHRTTAAQLWNVRESYQSLITDLMAGAIGDDDARSKRDELQGQAGRIYAAAPRTSGKAFSKASDGLKTKEELTFSSDEIDQFLPEALRLNKGGA